MTAPALRIGLTLLCTLGACTPVPPDAPPRLARTDWPSARIAVASSGGPGPHLAGDTVYSSVVVVNTSTLPHTFWIGYSVQDPGGEWHDVSPVTVRLRPGETSSPQMLRWAVPPSPGAVSGSYRAVMAVWDGRPGAASRRLDDVDLTAAFQVGSAGPPSPGVVTWHAGDHPLGRGRVSPANVVLGEPILLRLPGGSCDGAEIRSDGRYREGIYRIRMRTPLAPGSLSAFFLYEDVRDGNDEIDIEIPNDGSRRVLLNTWVGGRHTNEVERLLPFDPTAGYHEYAIELREGSVRFLADGALLHELTSRLPTRPMRLLANLWWPRWMECSRAEGDLFVERVEISP